MQTAIKLKCLPEGFWIYPEKNTLDNELNFDKLTEYCKHKQKYIFGKK